VASAGEPAATAMIHKPTKEHQAKVTNMATAKKTEVAQIRVPKTA
jgi:hypothetical protein